VRPRSRLNGLRYRLRWKLRVLRSNLEVAYDDVRDWCKRHFCRPGVYLCEFYGRPVRGGGQRLELRVEEGPPSQVVTAYLDAAEAISLDERRVARGIRA
jgi:hypothetical protein